MNDSYSFTYQPPDISVYLCRYRRMTDWVHQHMPAPCWRLYHNPQPGAWVQRDEQRTRLTPAHAVLIPPGRSLSTGHDRAFEHCFIHFSLNPSYQLKQDRLYRFKLNFGTQKMWHDYKRLLCNTVLPTVQHHFLIHHLITTYLHAIPATQWHTPVLEPRIRKSVEMIHQSRNHHFSVEQLAEIACLHPKSFTRLFKQHTGSAPSQYMLGLRLDGAARDLLHRESSVEQVAAFWAFTDRYHLTKLLKKHRHMTPGQYMKLGKP